MLPGVHGGLKESNTTERLNQFSSEQNTALFIRGSISTLPLTHGMPSKTLPSGGQVSGWQGRGWTS